MARRPVTLLQLGVSASLAVVPVLLAVLLTVASSRENDASRPSRNSDRHVSVRHVAALKTFERAIVLRDQVRLPLPGAESILERLPQCRREWQGAGGFLETVRRVLGRSAQTDLPPVARIALQLEAIDAALARFSSAANRRVVARVGLDGGRWLDAVAIALVSPVETPDYPGHRFAVQCSDIAAAVATLARSDARMLPALAWRGTEVDRVVAHWRADQFVEVSARLVARTNPWTGIPGCIYLRGAAESASPVRYLGTLRGLDEDVCSRADMLGTGNDGTRTAVLRIGGEPEPDMPVDDARWQMPPSLPALLQALEPLRRPGGSLYRQYTDPRVDDPGAFSGYRYGANHIERDGHPVDVGFSVDVTIDPRLQALAQRTAACYTGRADVCRALEMVRAEDVGGTPGQRMLEGAMVRMAAIAIVDVASGRIDALAGTLSPCTREEYDGPGRSRHCEARIPYPIRYRPDALLNPAVFHDAMPASTIKPIMAAAFLADPVVGPRWLAAERAEIARSPRAVPSAASLRGQLMRSDSARFLDRAFCADRGFADCDRLWSIQSTALAFGWNALCSPARLDCGKRDLLFGTDVEGGNDGALQPPAMEALFGRLLTEPADGRMGGPFRARPRIKLDPGKVRRCALGADGRRPSEDDWEKCGGGVVVDVVAEGWGQGHARASVIGNAGMMATLAASANGQRDVPNVHLVDALRGAGPAETSRLRSAAARSAESRRSAIPRDAAQVILSGLSFGHRAGTSRLACEQVFDARTCAGIDWIAGKTGTPTFPNDDRSLDELKRLCVPGAVLDRRDRAACGPLRPYKWYVAAYRSDRNDARWTKVIAVLTERNWIAATGRIHGAGDHGPNPAAEIAMQIAARHVGMLDWKEP